MKLASLETLVRRAANGFGVDITRYRPGSAHAGRLATMLNHHGVDLLLDIGANIGQFGQSMRRAGYVRRIQSFEPLASAHGQLVAATRDDPGWSVAPRVAIGDREGQIEIHVSENVVSSSALNMLSQHSIAAPESRYVASEIVRLSRLDTMVSEDLDAGALMFLKIDTQGYEDRVLDGAPRVLSRARGLQLELSLVPLYEEQQLFDALMTRLRALGFSVWGIWPGFHDPSSGRMLQVDAVFFRD